MIILVASLVAIIVISFLAHTHAQKAAIKRADVKVDKTFANHRIKSQAIRNEAKQLYATAQDINYKSDISLLEVRQLTEKNAELLERIELQTRICEELMQTPGIRQLIDQNARM